MAKLIVRNFGPISHMEVEFRKLTMFVGPQGSGKSTLAKLYSMFIWLEKRLIRGLETKKHIEGYSRFKKTYCGYNRLTSCFRKDTYIEFIGQAYTFLYEAGGLHINELTERAPEVYKVMYVPSERNLLSVVDDFSSLKALPKSLVTFKDEFGHASKKYFEEFPLPINDTRFSYDKLNNVFWLKGKDFKIKLSEASSGFQALIPLLLVTRYLTDLVKHSWDGGKGSLSITEQEKLKKEVLAILDNKALNPDVKEVLLADISSKFSYSGFVNIVEEPEENLYPSSQRKVLYELIKDVNVLEGNQLVITTHSPFMINYLTLAVKGKQLLDDGIPADEVSAVVPSNSCIDIEDIVIYELKEGTGAPLKVSYGLPSDENFLNSALAETNTLFGRLEALEEL